MVMVHTARRRARAWVALAAALALLVAALVPKLQGHAINRTMLYLAILFLAVSRIWRRR
jgi:hypothetical protein